MIPVLLLFISLSGASSEQDSVFVDTTRAGVIETITYSADSLLFDPETGNIILSGTTRLDYRDMTLKADSIFFDSESEILTATGQSELIDRGESITGTSMVYSITSRRGQITDADSEYDFGFYHGETITRITSDEYNITEVYFTTCESDSAHYYFYSPMMKVFPDDKGIARPISLYIDDTPVMWLPYWVFPIRRGRQSGFTLPTIGQTTQDGRYLRNLGYYFAFSDYLDLYVHSDIMERSRFVLTATERHRIRYICNGKIELQWRREFENKRDRWMIDGDHFHSFEDGTELRFQGEFTSDRSYMEETQQTPAERMTGELRSWASVNRYFGRMSFQIALDRTEYLHTNPDSIDNEILSVSELPSIRISLPSTPLFTSPANHEDIKPWHSVYYNFSMHYLSMDDRYEDTRTTNSGLKISSNLSGSSRLWGWLSVSPRVNFSGTVYDRDIGGEKYPWWLYSSTGISLSTDIYGVFNTNILGLTALRHTITPSASFNHSPDRYLNHNGFADTDSSGGIFNTFSGFGLPYSSSTLSLSLQNRFEGKKIENGRISRFELASIRFSTSANLESDERPFSPLNATLDISHGNIFSFRASGSWNMYDKELSDVSISSTLRLSGIDRTLLSDSGYSASGLPVNITLSHYYRLGLQESDDISKLRASASIDITPAWSLEYSAYYDILAGAFINQSYTLRRDLHCWEAVFTRHISDIDSGFYFKINIVDLPDIKIEQHLSSF